MRSPTDQIIIAQKPLVRNPMKWRRQRAYYRSAAQVAEGRTPRGLQGVFQAPFLRLLPSPDSGLEDP